jgi:hypothetical protein
VLSDNSDWMTFREFTQATAEPAGVSAALRALWHAGRGNWDEAHRIVMDEPGEAEAWVHAYLHRKEGDLPNAAYWYRRAGRPTAGGSLDSEWTSIVRALLPV